MASQSSGVRGVAVGLGTVVMLALTVPFAGAAVPPCRVTNTTTDQVYDGTGSNLQAAIDAAAPGTELRVRGVCVGNYSIAKRLRLVGWPTVAFPAPTLDGDDDDTVLTVSAMVSVDGLTLTRGSALYGGGIHNSGTLTLTGSSRVTRNDALGNLGAGVYNTGTLALRRSASIVGNDNGTGDGGGVYNEGTVELRGSSSISGNRAGTGGGVFSTPDATVRLFGKSSISNNGGYIFAGGIHNEGRVVMNDWSSISDNRAVGDFPQGGGVANLGIMIMNDASSVVGNTAGDEGHGETLGGGGIYNEGALTMRNSSSVSGNSTLPNSVGGGITNSFGTVTLYGQSSVRGNTAMGSDGGGIYNSGTVTMNGDSTVRRNTAVSGVGGGIFNRMGTLMGAVAGLNVFNNVPDDITST